MVLWAEGKSSCKGRGQCRAFQALQEGEKEEDWEAPSRRTWWFHGAAFFPNLWGRGRPAAQLGLEGPRPKRLLAR